MVNQNRLTKPFSNGSASLTLVVVEIQNITPERLPLGPIVKPILFALGNQLNQLLEPERRNSNNCAQLNSCLLHSFTSQQNKKPAAAILAGSRQPATRAQAKTLCAAGVSFRAITSGKKTPAPPILPREN